MKRRQGERRGREGEGKGRGRERRAAYGKEGKGRERQGGKGIRGEERSRKAREDRKCKGKGNVTESMYILRPPLAGGSGASKPNT